MRMYVYGIGIGTGKRKKGQAFDQRLRFTITDSVCQLIEEEN